MSSSNEVSKSQLEFESLLQRAKDKILSKPSSALQALSPTSFELLVFKTLREVAVGGRFEGTFIHTKDREFPDVVTSAFGVEVKATKDDNWKSTGNSVLESSRVKGVEKIYVFFGKLGGESDVAYKNYEECLSGISVTHNPRYTIDMELDDKPTIFDHMGVTYEELRASDKPIRPIRTYYKTKLKPGESLWWIDDDLDATATSDPIIKTLKSLSSSEQDYIKADIFVHLPEVFSNSINKYERVPAYLTSAHSVLPPRAIRDFFTSNGRSTMVYEKQKFTIPKIIGEAIRLKSQISEILSDKMNEDLSEAWNQQISDFNDPLLAWLNYIDAQTHWAELPISFSKIFCDKHTEIS